MNFIAFCKISSPVGKSLMVPVTLLRNPAGIHGLEQLLQFHLTFLFSSVKVTSNKKVLKLRKARNPSWKKHNIHISVYAAVRSGSVGYFNEDMSTVLSSFCPSPTLPQYFLLCIHYTQKSSLFFALSVSNTLWNANYSIYFH